MKLEEVTSCPICKGTNFGKPIVCKDHTATGEMFHVKHCLGCGLGITSPRPHEIDSSVYYQSDKYISHTGAAQSFIDYIYLIIRQLTTGWKYDLVRPFLHEGALLDYGCGTGAFLHKVQRRHSLITGVEPSEEARKKILAEIPVFSRLADLPDQKYTVITLWHVLEHIYPLHKTLRELKGRLTADGAMFLAVPNYESPDALRYGVSWAAYDVPRHLWHFSRKSMATFLQQEGLRITSVIPMKLDAYYISFLSERYAHPSRGGIARTWDAFWAALQSNLKARKQINHSSLIYVVQK